MTPPVCPGCKCKEFEIIEGDLAEGAMSDKKGNVWTLDGVQTRQLRVGELVSCRECGMVAIVKA